MDLKDKIIVITGGGRGIGRALCERFAAESPKQIVVLDKDKNNADDVAEKIGGVAFDADVGCEHTINQIVQTIEKDFGPIDLFCANAGIGISGGVETSNDDWKKIIDVNFMSHVFSSRAVLPGMIERGSGYLLHTVSAAGLLTQLGSVSYAVTKHAALAFAEWLSITHYDEGIRVSCLCPQGVWTDMLKSDDPAITMLHEAAISAEKVADAVVEGIRNEQFLILPHPEVATYFQHKANDYERWLGGMRKLQRGLGAQKNG